jgi:hypothetical protein
MANEFVAKNGLISQNNSTVTGSLTVTGGITGSFSGSLTGTATLAVNAASAAYATTAADATGISSAITNNTNNNILTATGTGVINGESNLTFDTVNALLTLTNGNLTFAGSSSDTGKIQQSLGGSAFGLYAHAQGLAVYATGNYSHAEGSAVTASGFASHAEGSGSATLAKGLYGAKFNTITSGVFQLAGDVTAIFAPGNRLYYNSAAYPDNTSFVVDTSVFGGVNTTITLTNTGINDSSFIVGSLDYSYSSWAGNQQSVADGGHAEGWYTNAVADWSHTEGFTTQTFGRYAHAEGYRTQAIGLASHAEGRDAKTFGPYSHAEGAGTTANGYASHAEGEFTVANGASSHAEGNDTQANNVYSHAEGTSTAAGIQYGYLATVSTPGVIVVNASYGDLTVTGTGLFTAGATLGIDDSAYDNDYTFTNQIILSCSFDGTNTTINLLDTSISTTSASIGSISDIGVNAGDQYWGGYSAHAEGTSTFAIGNSAHAEGNSYAFGNYSHAEGGGYAYGEASHAEGSGQAHGGYSHAEGIGQAYSNSSHAEGSGTAGVLGFGITIPIASGVIELDARYGDQTAQFVAGGFVIVDDNQGEIVPGVITTYIYEIASSTFNGTPATEITLVDTSVNTASNKARIGIYGVVAPTAADISIGGGSHAEGETTQTIGTSAHAAGYWTQALGYYQSVVGQFNQPISQPSAFIVGDGVDDTTRHNLLVAASGSVTISGSLLMSGSLKVTGSIYTDSIIYSPFIIGLNFETNTPYTFNAPYSFYISSSESNPSGSITIKYQASGSALTSSYVYGDSINKFDSLIITPPSISLVILNSVKI